tara:strand:+ start:53232 stop:53720 length:489 start_codon:yes stop_codon:yes gene_type:complete
MPNVKVKYSSKKGLYTQAGTGIDFGNTVVKGGTAKVFSHTATSGDLTLGAGDSGCIVSVSGNAASQKIKLPLASAVPGFHCSIMLTAVPGNDLDVEETTTTNNFITINIVGGANSDGLTGNQTLRFDVSAPSVAGDMATLYSDGTNYIVTSQSTNANAILAV